MTEMRDSPLTVQRDQITPYSFSQPFWDATRDRKLLVQRCKVSGQYQYHPRPVSIVTGRPEDIEWCEVDGAGAICSYSATFHGPKQFRGHEPYLVIIVQLDIGVEVVSNLVRYDAADVRVGRRVEPYWHPLEDGTHLLMFQPVASC